MAEKDSMEAGLTLAGVRDGLRRCNELIANCDGALDRIKRAEADLAVKRSEATNRRAALEKALAALEALRLVLEGDDGA